MAKCPRPLAIPKYHWWYLDDIDENDDIGVIKCVCKTCNQKMLLSADAEEIPAT